MRKMECIIDKRAFIYGIAFVIRTANSPLSNNYVCKKMNVEIFVRECSQRLGAEYSDDVTAIIYKCLKESAEEELLQYLWREQTHEDIRLDEVYSGTPRLVRDLVSAGRYGDVDVFVRDFRSYIRWLEDQRMDPVRHADEMLEDMDTRDDGDDDIAEERSHTYVERDDTIENVVSIADAPKNVTVTNNITEIVAPIADVTHKNVTVSNNVIESASPVVHVTHHSNVTIRDDVAKVVEVIAARVSTVYESKPQPYSLALVSIASKIATLRSIDLSNRQHKFRSAESVISSELYTTQLSLVSEQRRNYLIRVFPPLLDVPAEVHADIINTMLAARYNAGDMSAVILEYECILREVMAKHGEERAARIMAIGNATSVWLDPPKAPRVKRPKKPRQMHEAILLDEVEVRSIEYIADAVNRCCAANQRSKAVAAPSRIEMLSSYLSERTVAFGIHLDNIKRRNTVDAHNRTIQKLTEFVSCKNAYMKISASICFVCKRRKFLLENLRALESEGLVSSYVTGVDVAQACKAVTDAHVKKREWDIKAIGVVCKGHTRFYRGTLLPTMERAAQIINADAIMIALEIHRVITEAGCKAPRKIIRTSSAKKRTTGVVSDVPGRIVIKHSKTQHRYRVMDEEVPDFSTMTKREKELMNMKTEGADPKKTIYSLVDTLISVSSDTETTSNEIATIAKMIRAALDNIN